MVNGKRGVRLRGMIRLDLTGNDIYDLSSFFATTKHDFFFSLTILFVAGDTAGYQSMLTTVSDRKTASRLSGRSR